MARDDYEKVDYDNSDEESLPRTSGEARRHDQETLSAEEEAEKLLHGGDNDDDDDDIIHRRGSGSKKRRRFGFIGVHTLIVIAFLLLLFGAYKITQSGLRRTSKSHDSDGSSASGKSRPELEDGHSDQQGQTTYKAESLSNGTHAFKPTTILISLDGFRVDFLHRDISPFLASLIQAGTSPKYMMPSFPSLTFPNHFTLVTGLHPESHGIVGNTFFDPEMDGGKDGKGKQFDYGNAAKSMRPEWWTAEPLWLTAEKQGMKTAIHMWPGSEAHIGGIEPAYVDKYNGNEALGNKIRRILGWLDLPGENEDASGSDELDERPQLIAAYVPDVDSDSHGYGPNSTYIRTTIREVDSMIGVLLDGLEERNLTEIVNVVIVSDHGMATTSTKRLIQLEDLIDTSLIEHIDGWPLFGLRPYDGSKSQLKDLKKKLSAASQTPKYNGAFKVYLRDEDMPERYHFSDNHRIAPLWIVPTPGWAITTKDEFNVADAIEQDLTFSPKGLHGYDNQHPLMRAIFVARGPAFPHPSGSLLEPFQNTEVYNIICDSLGLDPVPNNGTLRLPLKPSGLHEPDQVVDVPEDPQDDQILALPPPDSADPPKASKEGSDLPPEVANIPNRPDLMVPTEGVPSLQTATTKLEQPDATLKPSPTGSSKGEQGTGGSYEEDGHQESDEKGGSWWNWVTGKINAAKGWASSLFDSKKHGKGNAGGDKNHRHW